MTQHSKLSTWDHQISLTVRNENGIIYSVYKIQNHILYLGLHQVKWQEWVQVLSLLVKKKKKTVGYMSFPSCNELDTHYLMMPNTIILYLSFYQRWILQSGAKQNLFLTEKIESHFHRPNFTLEKLISLGLLCGQDKRHVDPLNYCQQDPLSAVCRRMQVGLSHLKKKRWVLLGFLRPAFVDFSLSFIFFYVNSFLLIFLFFK